jgi:hypothetical protein
MKPGIGDRGSRAQTTPDRSRLPDPGSPIPSFTYWNATIAAPETGVPASASSTRPPIAPVGALGLCASAGCRPPANMTAAATTSANLVPCPIASQPIVIRAGCGPSDPRVGLSPVHRFDPPAVLTTHGAARFTDQPHRCAE